METNWNGRLPVTAFRGPASNKVSVPCHFRRISKLDSDRKQELRQILMSTTGRVRQQSNRQPGLSGEYRQSGRISSLIDQVLAARDKCMIASRHNLSTLHLRHLTVIVAMNIVWIQ